MPLAADNRAATRIRRRQLLDVIELTDQELLGGGANPSLIAAP
jgi:hypothetical protein